MTVGLMAVVVEVGVLVGTTPSSMSGTAVTNLVVSFVAVIDVFVFVEVTALTSDDVVTDLVVVGAVVGEVISGPSMTVNDRRGGGWNGGDRYN